MKKQWFNLQSKGSHLDIYLYGVIGGWDVDVNTFLDQVKSVPNPETVTVYLNTVGGLFYDGLPIYNTLDQMNAVVTVNVMGYALSMGSVIMLAGDKVRMAQNGLVMIHRANTYTVGDAPALRKEADILEKHETGILKIYSQRMNKTPAEVLAMLDEETWLTADEALAIGMIDEIIDPIDTGKAVEEAFADNEAERLIGNYHKIPAQLSAALSKPPEKSNFFKTLLGFGNKSKSTEPPTTTTDDDMTPDEVKTIVNEAVSPIKADLEKAKTDLATMQESNTALGEKNTALEDQVSALSAELAELKKPDNPTRVPENSGASDDQPEYEC